MILPNSLSPQDIFTNVSTKNMNVLHVDACPLAITIELTQFLDVESTTAVHGGLERFHLNASKWAPINISTDRQGKLCDV